ncbi:MAG: UDP-N-acetylmuramoyl-L-alanyl-D-glutamate--2,6-diaminopimelate ligase [Proteobacteria bacterium]|nr:UDP-N-acetylmuramoyl-L-alanyl-D-glutamate--2,6-diaminopimelate ligase [Pseudomonadota bacterium]
MEALANGNPQNRMKLAGITGTNGKTSTVWLMRGLLDQTRFAMVTLGTLGMYFKNQYVPTSHTSPDPDYLYPALAHALAAGADCCGMEVSSHSLAQEKIWPLRFDFAAFTSFSRDHMDFHGTEENYFAAKAKLFTEQLTGDARVALHHSVAGRVLTSGFKISPDSWVYGLEFPPQHWAGWNQMSAAILNESSKGTEIEIMLRPRVGDPLRFQGTVPVFGSVFVENFMAAFLGFGKISGTWPDPATWTALKPVPGRMELVPHSAEGPYVFVDYAHTPDAISQVSAFARKIADSRKSKLWCVFGCGGERDQGKRALMAQAAAAISDWVIVTSDNPRSENPDAIIDQIMTGFPENYRANHVQRISDRAAAILHAVCTASKDDVLLIAGKGHEAFQEIAGRKAPFDDRLVASDALRSRKKS